MEETGILPDIMKIAEGNVKVCNERLWAKRNDQRVGTTARLFLSVRSCKFCACVQVRVSLPCACVAGTLSIDTLRDMANLARDLSLLSLSLSFSLPLSRPPSSHIRHLIWHIRVRSLTQPGDEQTKETSEHRRVLDRQHLPRDDSRPHALYSLACAHHPIRKRHSA